MAVEAERWTRGSGNGIGPSSHKNQYRWAAGNADHFSGRLCEANAFSDGYNSSIWQRQDSNARRQPLRIMETQPDVSDDLLSVNRIKRVSDQLCTCPRAMPRSDS